MGTIDTSCWRIAMLQSDVRTLLYKLCEAGYVRLQDVPNRPDRVPSRTFYTWKALGAADGIDERVGIDLYRTARQVMDRFQHEMAKQRKARWPVLCVARQSCLMWYCGMCTRGAPHGVDERVGIDVRHRAPSDGLTSA